MLPLISPPKLCKDSYGGALSFYYGFPKGDELYQTKTEQNFPEINTFLTVPLSQTIREKIFIHQNQTDFIEKKENYFKIITKEEIAIMMIDFITKYKEYGNTAKRFVNSHNKLRKVLSVKNLDSIDEIFINVGDNRLLSPSAQNFQKESIKLDCLIGSISDDLNSNYFIYQVHLNIKKGFSNYSVLNMIKIDTKTFEIEKTFQIYNQGFKKYVFSY